MMGENFGSAFQSLWGNKVRSLLTMLGVIIGVTSVTTLVAMGQGLKNDVSGLIEGLGTNIVAVTAGKLDTSGKTGATNPAAFIASDILTRSDVDAVRKVDGVAGVVPLGIVPGIVKFGDKTASPTIAGTDANFLSVVDVMKVTSGRMFNEGETGVVVFGTDVATDVFGSSTDAVGKTVTIGTKQFTVIGLTEQETTSSIFGSQFANMVIVPFADATVLNKNKETINRIIAKAVSAEEVNPVKDRLHEVMLKQHNGEEDFTVLTQKDILGLFDQFLNLATAMVSAIAAISLIVGGIGIMNIMLVTVTERTREIGLRKAVGATRGAILVQFLVEAIIVTLIGGLIGLGISLAIGAAVAHKTPLHPAFTPSVIATALGISIVIGAIFGIWPAMRAARKDPIEALRYE